MSNKQRAANQRSAVRTWPGLFMDDEVLESRLRSYLGECTIRELRAIGRRRGFRLRGTRKASIIDQLVAALRESTRNPDVLHGLTDDEYNTLLLFETVFGIEDTLYDQDSQRAWQMGKMPGGKEKLRLVMNGLFEYGLLFPCRGYSSGPPHHHWLPDLVLLQLPAQGPAFATLPRRKKRRLSQPKRTIHVLKALWLLVTFVEGHDLHMAPSQPQHYGERFYAWLQGWDYDKAEADRLIKRGYGAPYHRQDADIKVPVHKPSIASNELEQLAKWVRGGPDFAEWLVLMATGSLVLSTPQSVNDPLILEHENWNAIAGLSPEDQLMLLFHTWRQHMAGFMELSLALRRQPKLRVVRSITQPSFQPDNLASDLGQARRFVVRMLKYAPAQQWLDWNRFSAELRKANPLFLHSGHSQTAWGFATQEGKRLDPQDPHHWDMAYRPALAAMFEGPLRWLGIVDIAYRGNTLVAFQLTEAGAWVLRGEGRPLPDDAKEAGKPLITWTDERTFQLRLTPQTTDFLKRASRLATPLDRPFTYRLTNESIERAFIGGMEPAAMVQAFDSLGVAVPATTCRLLEDSWSRFGRVHLYENLTVLEVADDMALREIMAHTNLGEHIIHEFSPHLVVVEDSAVDAVAKALVEKGYTPRVEKHRK